MLFSSSSPSSDLVCVGLLACFFILSLKKVALTKSAFILWQGSPVVGIAPVLRVSHPPLLFRSVNCLNNNAK
jgi:hypothetical protein